MKGSLVAIAVGVLAVHAALAENSNNSILPKPQPEETLCIALYKPATCTGLYGGEWYKENGTNECFAIKNLVKKINESYAWFVEVRAEDIQQLACQETSPNIE
jgi:hypothetical protein